jgi:hypothetical protein
MTIPLKRKVKLEILFISSPAFLVVNAAYTGGQATARESTNSSPASASSTGVVAPSADLVVMSLDEAIRRAQANEPAHGAAVAACAEELFSANSDECGIQLGFANCSA